MSKITMKQLRTIYLDQVKQASILSELASKSPGYISRGAEFVGPLAGKGVTLAIKGAVPAAAVYGGVKAYQGGKRKVQEHRIKKYMRQQQRAQMQMLKGASAPIDWKTLGLMTVGLPAAGAAIAGGIEGIRRLYYAAKKGRDFNNMLEANPGLAREAEVDPKGVRMAFDTMHRLNPQLAREPLVAGTFVRRTLDTQLGGGGMYVDPAAAKMLSDAYAGRVSPTQTAMSMATTVPKAMAAHALKGEEAPKEPEEFLPSSETASGLSYEYSR